MRILEKNEFSTKLISESTETESPKSQLVVNGEAINSFIEGAIFESCVSYNEFYLVFTTNDCPFEESLNISYLNKEFKLLDQACLVWPYATGTFTLMNITAPNIVAFKFFEESVWQIELYTEQKTFLPYVSEPSGVWRKFKFKHYFKISKDASQRKISTENV